MPQIEPKQPGAGDRAVAETTEEKLRREVADLRRQLQERQGLVQAPSHAGIWHPSGLTIAAIALVAVVVIVAAFFAGYIPLQKRTALIRGEAQVQEQSLPRVEVITVERASLGSGLELPGNIQALTEAPVLARADGYIRRRLVDIGDRLRAGQPMAEIDAPELDQQVLQARANLQQTQAALDQAQANYQQGKSNLELAKVTAERWGALAAQGVVSRQENDQYQAQYQSQIAGVQALEKAIAAQRGNIAAAQANLARLDEMQGYRVVKAPFDGVVTLRNVDVGALVNAGNTLLFRIAQTSTLRAYVSVPQANANFVRPGQAARVSVANLPGRFFAGTVARSASSLDPASRTMLVEIQVPNPDGALLPGMYAQINLNTPQNGTAMLIPGDALVVRAEGPQVAVVRPDHSVHLQNIKVGRDYGDRLEVVGGLQAGDVIIQNPGDAAREGLKVAPVARADKAAE